jgi:hypothetical protein
MLNWEDDLLSGTSEISEDAVTAFHQEEARSRQALAEIARRGEADPLESLSADQILELHRRSEAAQAHKDAGRQVRENAQIFVAEEPWYVQNPQNAQRVADYLTARYGEAKPWTTDQFHEAFTQLNERRLLQVKETPATPRRRYTEADLYAMPYDQLQALATGAL